MGKKILFFISLIFISGLIISTAGATAVIIGFKDKAYPKMISPFGKAMHSYNNIPAITADLPDQVIEYLKKNDNIAYIEPDYEVKALEQTVPWGITRIGAPMVHSSGNKGAGINVAIIDTGIDYTNPDLQSNYKGGYDFENNDADPLDDNGHGTQCSGIIAATDNDIGVIGVAPQVNLYSLKVLDSSCRGSASNVIAAIDWAIQTRKDSDTSNDIHIISMSFGSPTDSSALQSICSKAYASGILLVAAAGNKGNALGKGNSVDYPAAYDSVIAVAATDSSINNTRASFSNTGSDVELAAPGVDIISTCLGSGYCTMSGTSMACPYVAGTAALVMYSHPSFTDIDIRKRLDNTATDLGPSGKDKLYGYGLVNAYAAAST
jgi:subtilisin